MDGRKDGRKIKGKEMNKDKKIGGKKVRKGRERKKEEIKEK